MTECGSYLAAIGKAKDVTCPVCLAECGERCWDAPTSLQEGPYHVERGRMARWVEMGVQC